MLVIDSRVNSDSGGIVRVAMIKLLLLSLVIHTVLARYPLSIRIGKTSGCDQVNRPIIFLNGQIYHTTILYS